MHQNMSSGMLQRPEEKQDPHEHLGETQGIFFAIKFTQPYPLILYEIFSSLFNVAHILLQIIVHLMIGADTP